jgi:fatty acid desaturase
VGAIQEGRALSSLRTEVPKELLASARMGRLLRFAACDWAVIAATWLAMALGPAWIFPLGVLIVAGRLQALGVVLHDACHMPRGRRARFGGLLQLLAGYPIATTLEAMRYHHLRHHRASGMPTDPYLKPGISHDALRRNVARLRGLILVPAWIVRGFYGSAALVFPALRGSYGRILLQDKSGRDLTHDAGVLECLREEPKQALFWIVVGLVAWQYPVAVAAYYLLPLLLAGALNVNRVIVEHIHVPCADRRPATVIATTVTHDWGAPGKLILFPRNIGFHVVHHLHPQVALEGLPALDRWYRRHAASTRPHLDALPAKEQEIREQAQGNR